jgi:hypothetical protein
MRHAAGSIGLGADLRTVVTSGMLRPSKIATVVLVLFYLVPCPAMFSQQSSSIASTLLDFKSRDVDRRVAAYEKIKTNQKALQRSDVKNALMGLLDRENLYVHKTLEDSDGQEGVGEGFGSYHDDLIQTVMKIADWHNSREVCVLARTEVEPGSRLASMLAKDGGATMVPCLLKIAQGDAFGHKDTAFMESDDRTEAIPLLVEIGAVAGDLSTADRALIRKATIEGLRDPDAAVRFVTVRAVADYGTPALIPALEDIAHSDPVSRPGNNGVGIRYDIREAAAKAIESIQDRAKSR